MSWRRKGYGPEYSDFSRRKGPDQNGICVPGSLFTKPAESYRKISWSLEAVSFRHGYFLSFWNLIGISAAALVAWRHQSTAGTNIDLSSKEFCGMP